MMEDDLISRARAIEAIDPDGIYPLYIVETIKTRLRELPASSRIRKKAANNEQVNPPTPNSDLTIIPL